MREEIQTIVYTCDMCGKNITELEATTGVSENEPHKIDSFKTVRWYRKTKIFEHFCSACRYDLESFIFKSFPKATGTEI